MKIVLGNFKDNDEKLVTFLEPKIGVKPTSSGGELTIDDDKVKKGMKPQQVKTYIKRFLLKEDARELYKIIVEGDELTLVYLEEMEKEEEEEEEEKRKEKQEKAEERKEKEEEEEKVKKEKAEEKKEKGASQQPKQKKGADDSGDEEEPKGSESA